MPRVDQIQQSECFCFQDFIFTEVTDRGPSGSATQADENDDRPIGNGSVGDEFATFIKGSISLFWEYCDAPQLCCPAGHEPAETES